MMCAVYDMCGVVCVWYVWVCVRGCACTCVRGVAVSIF